jgi:hypothetical protein
MTQNIAITILLVLGFSPFIFSSLIDRPRYRIKEVENVFIPQVRRVFTWYSIGECSLSLFYENTDGEKDFCTFNTMNEAIKILERYKEEVREKEVKYHEYN